MKKFLLLLLLIGGSVPAQEKLTYGTAGSVYGQEGQRISPEQVRTLMKDNAQALKLYNAGRSKKTWGNVLFYSGIGLAAINLYQGFTDPGPTFNSSTDRYEDDKVKPTLAIVGGALFLASIPIKIGYPKRIKAALEHYNGPQGQAGLPVDFQVVADADGLGIRIQF